MRAEGEEGVWEGCVVELDGAVAGCGEEVVGVGFGEDGVVEGVRRVEPGRTLVDCLGKSHPRHPLSFLLPPLSRY